VRGKHWSNPNFHTKGEWLPLLSSERVPTEGLVLDEPFMSRLEKGTARGGRQGHVAVLLPTLWLHLLPGFWPQGSLAVSLTQNLGPQQEERR
jgi:hypothetical protein